MTELHLPEPRPCKDLNGHPISNNQRYTPQWDQCMVCTCDNGQHKLCQAVRCAPPRGCRPYQVGKECCEFICLDGGGDGGPAAAYPGGDSKDLGLRLVASAVTAVLSLALLLFLVYRLRQRRHRVAAWNEDFGYCEGKKVFQGIKVTNDVAERVMQLIQDFAGSVTTQDEQLQQLLQVVEKHRSPSLRPDEAYNTTLMTYLRGSGYLGGGGGGGRGSHDFYYEEPPPPYSLWKPPQPAAGEAPPPYSEAVRQPELRPGSAAADRGRHHAVMVLAPAIAAGCVQIARQRATVHRSEPDVETALDSDPDPDPDLDPDPDSEPISDGDLELGLSPELPERTVRRCGRDQRPDQVMQRFSLQLQLDCSDSSAGSSSPTLTPDAAPRPASLSSSNSSTTSDHSHG